MLAMRHDVADHPAARVVLEKVHRSFTKPAKQGFNRALLRSITTKEIHTAAGVYLGNAPAYNVDLDRLCRVIKQTVLGLFSVRFGHRLPDDYRCTAYALDGFPSVNNTVEGDLRQILDYALQGDVYVWGEKVFSAWCLKLEGHSDATLWACLVYSKEVFIALTEPATTHQDGQAV
jgi:hypothetical protein